ARSCSAATGITWSRANSRASAWNCFCSLVSSKSITPLPSASPLELPVELAVDDHALDLARALVDLRDARVPEVALDGEVLRVTVTAQDLHGVVRDRRGGLGGEQLRHRRLPRHAVAAVLQPRRPQRQQPRGVDARGHVGELEADALELVDRAPEGLALVRVAARGLERGAGDADRLRRDPDAAAVERRHRHHEALALAADASRLRHEAALEGHAARHGGVLPELLLGAPERHAVGTLLDEERAHAASAGRRVGLGHDDVELRLAARSDPGLRAGQEVAAVDALGARA